MLNVSIRIIILIRENITPRGDGNPHRPVHPLVYFLGLIRENITPRGDGNTQGD